METPVTVRFTADEIREMDKLAKALGVSRAEVLRRNWRSSPADETAEILTGLVAAVAEFSARLDEQADAGILEKLDALHHAQAQQNNVLAMTLDTLESIQKSLGWREAGAPVPCSTRSAATMTFTDFLSQQPGPREGETPTQRHQRIRAEFVAQGGRL